MKPSLKPAAQGRARQTRKCNRIYQLSKTNYACPYWSLQIAHTVNVYRTVSFIHSVKAVSTKVQLNHTFIKTDAETDKHNIKIKTTTIRSKKTFWCHCSFNIHFCPSGLWSPVSTLYAPCWLWTLQVSRTLGWLSSSGAPRLRSSATTTRRRGFKPCSMNAPSSRSWKDTRRCCWPYRARH